MSGHTNAGNIITGITIRTNTQTGRKSAGTNTSNTVRQINFSSQCQTLKKSPLANFFNAIRQFKLGKLGVVPKSAIINFFKRPW